MFIARPAHDCFKLRRSGMSPRWGLDCFGDGVGYKHVAPLGLMHRLPGEILKSLAKLETEIQQGMKELEGMLK